MSGNKPFGDFLRTRRQRLDPAALGFMTARRRRAQGLRREEVAVRAGISCEWYIKLEQGREVSPSSSTVASLAKALTLNSADTAHLHKLAQARGAQTYTRETVSVIVASIVEGLPDPAYLTGARWDVLAYNKAADEIFSFSDMDEADRNIVLWMLSAPAARSLFGDDWAAEARRMLALFRVAHDQHAGNASFESLTSRLAQTSAEFRDWWPSHAIGSPFGGTKTLRSQHNGDFPYIYATFQSNDEPGLKLALYKRL